MEVTGALRHPPYQTDPKALPKEAIPCSGMSQVEMREGGG